MLSISSFVPNKPHTFVHTVLAKVAMYRYNFQEYFLKIRITLNF